MPLMWAHAEYIKLLRSVSDGKVFDLIPAVADRYQHRRECMTLEVWKPNRRIRTIRHEPTCIQIRHRRSTFPPSYSNSIAM